jgi:hypothetical protein
LPPAALSCTVTDAACINAAAIGTTQDLDTYNKAAVSIAKKYFAINDIDDYYKKKDARPLIFCHFARGLSDKTYDEVGTLSAAQPIITQMAPPYCVAVFPGQSRLMDAWHPAWATVHASCACPQPKPSLCAWLFPAGA